MIILLSTMFPWSLFILIGCCFWMMILNLGYPFFLCLNYYYIICVVWAFYMGVITPNIGTYLWLWCIYWIKIIKFSWWFHSKTYPHSWSPAAEKLTMNLSWIHPPMQNISSANQIKVCNRNPGYWVLYRFGHIIL